MAKRKQLETFINKNRANANTASQARNKKKQLARLELTEIEGEEKTVTIDATSTPVWASRPTALVDVGGPRR